MKTATVAVAVAMLGIVGCGSIAKTSSPTSTAPAAPASTRPASPPSSSMSGPVGTVYTVTDARLGTSGYSRSSRMRTTRRPRFQRQSGPITKRDKTWDSQARRAAVLPAGAE